MNWIKAKEIQVGFTVEIASQKIRVTKIEALVGSDDITITAEVGHNGVRGQQYNLKSWQEVASWGDQS